MPKSFGGNADAHVEGDDSAFILFIFVSVLVLAVPWLIILFKRVIWSLLGWYKLPVLFACPCPGCAHIKGKSKDALRAAWMTKGFVLQVLVIAVMGYLLVQMANHLIEIKNRTGFDPYEILGIPTSATERDIKMAYRKLAIEMHPDKRPDDPEAGGKFIRLNRAYSALTDPVSKENFLKYGNPDGPGTFSIGLPIPKFMLQDECKIYTLIGFCAFLLVVVPGTAWWIYNSVFRFNKHGIYNVNEEKFEEVLDSAIEAADVPAVMTAAVEYQERIRSEDATCDELMKLASKLKLNKGKDATDKDFKIQLLIEAFVNSIPLEDKKLQEEQQYILLLAPRMLSYLADMSIEGKYKKPLLFEILEFSQCFYQGVSLSASPFMQLPFVNSENIDKLRTQTKSKKENFLSFVSLTPEERQLSQKLDPMHAEAIETVIASYPRLNIKLTCCVENSEGFYAGDLMSIKVELDQSRGFKYNDAKTEAEEQAPFCPHTGTFPHPKQEILWLVIECKQDKTTYEYMKINRRFAKCKKSTLVPILKCGRIDVTVHARFDCYKGLDYKESTYVLAKAENLRPKEKFEEDPELKKQTAVESFVTSILGKSEDKDSEEEDKDAQPQEEVERPGMRKKRQVQPSKKRRGRKDPNLEAAEDDDE